VTEEEFKNSMSKIPTSVSIVSVLDNGLILGCTISSLVSINVETPELLFVLKTNSSILDSVVRVRLFSINILSQTQQALAYYYSSLRGLETLSGTKHPWTKDASELIFLDGSIVSFGCTLTRIEQLENSALIYGRVEKLLSQSDSYPLIYENRSFRN
jgi:flavin reductase (DIM6/NTAB) family NADH-FMN oxidoreductase RutF